MSVSILEELNAAGYDFDKPEDARWLVAQTAQFEQLVDMLDDMENDDESN